MKITYIEFTIIMDCMKQLIGEKKFEEIGFYTDQAKELIKRLDTERSQDDINEIFCTNCDDFKVLDNNVITKLKCPTCGTKRGLKYLELSLEVKVGK